MATATLLIAADDFTGGLDTGVQFARRGISVRVVLNPATKPRWADTDCQVIVAVTQSRHLHLSEAYDAVYSVIAEGRRAGIPFFYKKTDSALRGNIGAELGAALAASGARMLPFLPAFPRMGRVTRGGVHYIDGIPAAKSVFARDPLNPVLESDVSALIRGQTGVQVWNGSPAHIPTGCGICVVDAQSDEQLFEAGSRLADMGALTVSAGCAGFADALPRLLDLPEAEPPRMPPLGKGLLVVCGSVNPITRRQLDLAEKAGFRRVRIPASCKLNPDWFDAPEGREALAELGKLARGQKWLIVDANDADDANPDTQSLAGQMGLDANAIGERITDSLSRALAGALSDWAGPLMITGGDTLTRCMERLGAQELVPQLELYPGVVLSTLDAGSRDLPLITKSGGFGDERLLVDLKEMIERRT